MGWHYWSVGSGSHYVGSMNWGRCVVDLNGWSDWLLNVDGGKTGEGVWLILMIAPLS